MKYHGHVEILSGVTEEQAAKKCPWYDTIDTMDDGRVIVFELAKDYQKWTGASDDQ